MIDQPAQSISETAMQLDTGSLEMDEDGVLSTSKAEMMSLVKSQIERQCRQYEMDVTADEVECIAATALEIGSVDVAEIYSPHRFSARAEEFQLRPGFAADLVEWKPDGTPWDLTNPSDVKLLEEMLDEQEPALLTGSPPCETFSQLRNISRAKRDPVKVAAEEAAGRHSLHTSIYFTGSR